MQSLADVDYASDVYAFGDANHELLVVGSTEEGFCIWCRRCDRMGKRVYGSVSAAQQYVAWSRKDIAPACRSAERST
jgi:hypothetical protein